LTKDARFCLDKVMAWETFVPSAFAHEGEEEETVETPLTPARFIDRVQDLSLLGLQLTGAWVAVLLLISLLWRKKTEFGKWVLYLGIAVPVLLATLFSALGTVYLNLASVTGGPVHWHADFRVFACGQELDLIDPTGLANRVGSPVFHEHGDGRIHVEGVVVSLEDAALHNFFSFVGGELHDDHFSFPTNEKLYEFSNGDLCEGEGVGTLQVFSWKTDEERGEFYQEKLTHFEDYVISPHSNIPPGDCLIFEFGKEKDETENICSFYEVARQKGELKKR